MVAWIWAPDCALSRIKALCGSKRLTPSKLSGLRVGLAQTVPAGYGLRLGGRRRPLPDDASIVSPVWLVARWKDHHPRVV